MNDPRAHQFSLYPEGRPREQGEAKARRARLRARVVADSTTHCVRDDREEAAHRCNRPLNPMDDVSRILPA